MNNLGLNNPELVNERGCTDGNYIYVGSLLSGYTNQAIAELPAKVGQSAFTRSSTPRQRV